MVVKYTIIEVNDSYFCNNICILKSCLIQLLLNYRQYMTFSMINLTSVYLNSKQ